MGLPNFLQKVLQMKEYYTHQQQLEKLKERHLGIDDEDSVLTHLRVKGYYNLVNGYSEYFKYPDKSGKKKYFKNANFDHIVALYNFDKDLRSLIFKYTSSIESYIKESIAHEFSRVYGVDEDKYLKEECFSDKYPEDVEILLGRCRSVIEKSTEDESNNRYRRYLASTKEKHGHVPLWILIRVLTFGKASIFFKNMKQEDKERIAASYKLTADQMSTMLELVVFFRNIVAHGERTFCTNAPKTKISTNLSVVPKLAIQQNEKGVNKHGRSDFLALLICCKYFLPSEELNRMFSELHMLFYELEKAITGPMVGKIKIKMGLANKGWKNLPKLKI